MRMWALLALAATLILTGSIGTITDPELVDPHGDIEYEAYYLGPREQPEADVEAAWMDYEPSTDTIAVHIQVPSTLRFDDPSPLFSYFCQFRTNLTVEQQFSGRLEANWSFDPREPDAKSDVRYYAAPKGSPMLDNSQLAHTSELVVGEPGFYVWHIERAPLHLRGAEATDFYTLCSFSQIVTTTPDGFFFGGSLLGGADHGFGHRSYEYGDLRPAVQAVPEEEQPSHAPAPSSTWVQEGATSALGALAAVAVLSAVAFVRQKR